MAAIAQSAGSQLLGAYAPRVTGRDEMMMPDGSVAPVWQSFIAYLSGLTAEQTATRFSRGDQYLKDAGVYFRQYDDGQADVRDWPLSHIPVILAEAEWQQIVDGLTQRADLLEQVVADIYGDNSLVAAGHLPACLIADNPAWLRALVGVKPVSGHFLDILSFEVGRGPQGQWWVLSDLVDGANGAGFALENRVATSRVFSSHFADSPIHRLAGFFQTFQARLFGLKGANAGEIAVLTPGLLNDAYYEHAYIARYLGLLLVEGEDLVVQGNRVMVRTVAGLRPVAVLWRRLIGGLCDPLELDEASLLGTPGLVDAIRQGGVAVLNALGSGILETRAFMAFLPRISEVLTGKPLLLPNIATWWCGQPSEQNFVLDNKARLMIGSAFATQPLEGDACETQMSGPAPGGDTQPIDALLRQKGRDLVAQEAVTLSTTPVWEGGQLVPRPMSLRMFLVRTAQGWQAMPGGFARVSGGSDTTAVAMQRGGKVADVWIVSDRPVATPSLLSGAVAATDDAMHPRSLPSRAADNLFWLGRYVERSEMNMRLFRAYFARFNAGQNHNAALLTLLREELMNDEDPIAKRLATQFEAPLDQALRTAGRISDRVSTDGMMALRDLAQSTRRYANATIDPAELPRIVSILLRKITGFSGLVHENMYRSVGWRFLSLGISVERAANMASVLAALADEQPPETAVDGALDLALELGDSTLTYRSQHAVRSTRETVCDLLALDDANPRAILYHLSHIRQHISALPARDAAAGNTGSGRLSEISRLALKLQSGLAVDTPQTLTTERLIRLRSEIWEVSGILSRTWLQ